MRYYFGAFELDTDAFRLFHNGRAVAIKPQAFDLILCLIRNRDRVVPRAELFDTLWPDVVVYDGALSQAVYEARKALRCASNHSCWIRTARGRGFQFEGDVTTSFRAARSTAFRSSTSNFVFNNVRNILEASQRVALVEPNG